MTGRILRLSVTKREQVRPCCARLLLGLSVVLLLMHRRRKMDTGTNAISAATFVASCMIERFADWAPRSHSAILDRHTVLREPQRVGRSVPMVHFTHCQYGPLRSRCRLSGFDDLLRPYARPEGQLTRPSRPDKVLQVEYLLAYSG